MYEAETSKVELAGVAMEHLNSGELHEAEELLKRLIESRPQLPTMTIDVSEACPSTAGTRAAWECYGRGKILH